MGDLRGRDNGEKGKRKVRKDAQGEIKDSVSSALTRVEASSLPTGKFWDE